MKTLTKKELSDIHKGANKYNFDDFCKFMNSYLGIQPITTNDPKTLDQQRDDYYNRDKLLERQ